VNRVVATGVFDLLHPGHILYLTESRGLGDKLTVIVASDKKARENGKSPFFPQQHRAIVLSALRMVDEVVEGGEGDLYDTIALLKPDILTLGADQSHDEQEVAQKLRAKGLDTKVVRIQSYWDGDYNSSQKMRDALK